MKFGERYISSQHHPWSTHYIDYDRLKRLLRDIYDVGGDEASYGGRSPSGSIVVKHHRRGSSSNGGGVVGGIPLPPSPRRPRGDGDDVVDDDDSVDAAAIAPESFEVELKFELRKPLYFTLSTIGTMVKDISNLMERRYSLRQEVRVHLKSGGGGSSSKMMTMTMTTTSMSMSSGEKIGGMNCANDNDVVIDPRRHGEGEMDERQRLLDEITNIRAEYLEDIGMKLLSLLTFVEWNVESIIKLVKKHDKLLAEWETNGGHGGGGGTSRGEREGEGVDGYSHSVASSSRNRHHHHPQGRRRRLRREYLPRFAVYSSDPNVRCLYGAAADAGNDKRQRSDFAYDDNDYASSSVGAGRGSESSGGGISTFGGWDVVQYELGIALRDLYELENALRYGDDAENANANTNTTSATASGSGSGSGSGYAVASPPPHVAARSSHRKTLSSMSLLWNDGLRRIGLLAPNDDEDGVEKEEETTEARPLIRRAHVKSSSHLTGLFDPPDAAGIGDIGRPVKATLVRSSTFMGLRGLGGPYPSSSGMTTTTGRHDGMANTFFEPILYRIRSQRRRMGVTHNRYQSMIYAHEMLGITGSRDKMEGGKYPMMHKRDGSGSASDALLEGSIRRQSIGSAEDIGKMMAIIEEEAHSSFPTVSSFSKMLNLASAGLFMCNFNIIAPTSGLYADLLGFNPACAGIIIGMTPAANIVSAVLYSWWSSYSYQRALLFASSCCVVGNMLYALALPCKSLNMVLIGRFLVGFGSTRVVNRRYIADYYNNEDRTSGMADFVFSSALGMTAGPAIAASLSIVAPPNQSEANSYWTIETAPGKFTAVFTQTNSYVMFVLWSIYLCCNLMFFEEPDRNINSEKTPAASSSKVQLAEGGTSVKGKVTNDTSPLLNSSKLQVAYGGPSEAGTTHSKSSLISNVASVFRARGYQPLNLLRTSVNIPVLITMILIALLKTVLEGLSSSAPTISRHYFGWGVHSSGIYLAIQASFVLPTTFFISQISRKHDDRELILGILLVMFVGILGFLVYGDGGYSESRFIFFGIVIFSACNALEVPTMGLLSKTIPKSLAQGVLNAGLLATEAGTIGRVLGDIWFSRATFLGLEQMLNRTFIPMCAMVGLAIVAALSSYPYLQPNFQADSDDEDDDDD